MPVSSLLLHNEMMLNGGQPQRPDFPLTLRYRGEGFQIGIMPYTERKNASTISYSGGSDNKYHYVPAGIFDQKGIVINTDFNATFQFNNEAKVRNWLKFGNNLTLSHDLKRNGSYNILGNYAIATYSANI